MISMNSKGPQPIVCLTEEPTEILYLLGEEHRIVGITVYTVRPPEAKKRFPVVSAFIDGSVKRICELEPDLIIGFSDIQADLAAKLIRANQQVLIFNQRSIDEILEVILTIGRIVSAEDRARELVRSYKTRIEEVKQRSLELEYRPKVYFEEWDQPTFSAIRVYPVSVEAIAIGVAELHALPFVSIRGVRYVPPSARVPWPTPEIS